MFAKFLSPVLALLIMLSIFTVYPVTAKAYEYNEDGIYYRCYDNLTASVISYNGDFDTVIIPSYINDYRVTEISDRAFYNCKNIKSIVIPDTVTIICDYAFENCISLKSIDLGKGITAISRGLFLNCISLESITIPEYVDYIYHSYGYDYSYTDTPFKGCTSLKTLNYNAKNIPWYVFDYDDSFVLDLQSITTINIGASVDTIPDGVFSNFKNVKNINIESGVKNIPKKCFYGCTNLTNIEFPDSIIEIGESAFENCIRLSSVSFPQGLIKISEKSFNNCNSLTSVEIPQSVNYIGSHAFGYYGDDYPASSKIPDFLIKGYTKSKAYDYANENAFKFENMSDFFGDADGDGEVTVKDATYIQLYLANLLSEDKIDLTVCDMDSDGDINVKDATYIQLKLANLL